MRHSTAPLPLLAVFLCLALLPTVGWSQPARSSFGGILSLAWSPDGKHIATGNREGTLHLWGAASGKRTRVLATYPSPVVALAWSPDGRYVAASAGNGTLQILNVGSGRARRVLRGAQKVVSSLAWNRKGDRLAGTGEEGSVHVWNPLTGRKITSLRTDGPGSAVAWSPDGTRLAAGGGKHRPFGILLWDASTFDRQKAPLPHRFQVSAVAWSPDGRHLATGSAGGAVQLWSVPSWKPLRTLGGHLGSIRSLTWSRNGKRLASTAGDQSLRVWDPTSGRDVRSYHSTNEAFAFDWAPNGQDLVIGDQQSVLWRFSLRPGTNLVRLGQKPTAKKANP